MLSETVTAGFLIVCLAVFFTVNLHNVLRFRQSRKNKKVHAEIRRPKNFTLSLAAFGTLLFFLESVFFSFLAFAGFTHALQVFPLQLQFQYDSYVQIVGIVLTGTGYFLFIWSVIARGKYAVSWAMSENHRLVTWGPYRYVRHPSYLGYFLMFSGFFLIWLNLVTLLPLVGVLGYVRATLAEEELLIRRFGEEYIKYLEKTGRFFPRPKQS